MATEKIILQDSPDAAQYRTDINGWVSRDGLYFGNGPESERLARLHGCTHSHCRRCSLVTKKPREICDSCLEAESVAKHKAMPRAHWDGVAPLYSLSRDEYYSSPGEAAEFLEIGETLEDLRLVICKPNYARQIDRDDFYDDLPEDEDLPNELIAAIEAFNKAVAGIVLSWYPGKTALKTK